MIDTYLQAQKVKKSLYQEKTIESLAHTKNLSLSFFYILIQAIGFYSTGAMPILFWVLAEASTFVENLIIKTCKPNLQNKESFIFLASFCKNLCLGASSLILIYFSLARLWLPLFEESEALDSAGSSLPLAGIFLFWCLALAYKAYDSYLNAQYYIQKHPHKEEKSLYTKFFIKNSLSVALVLIFLILAQISQFYLLEQYTTLVLAVGALFLVFRSIKKTSKRINKISQVTTEIKQKQQVEENPDPNIDLDNIRVKVKGLFYVTNVIDIMAWLDRKAPKGEQQIVSFRVVVGDNTSQENIFFTKMKAKNIAKKAGAEISFVEVKYNSEQDV